MGEGSRGPRAGVEGAPRVPLPAPGPLRLSPAGSHRHWSAGDALVSWNLTSQGTPAHGPGKGSSLAKLGPVHSGPILMPYLDAGREDWPALSSDTVKDSLLIPFMALSVLPFEGARAPEDPSTVKSESFLAGETLARGFVLPRLSLPL